MFIHICIFIYQNIPGNLLEVKIWNRNVKNGQTVDDVLLGSAGPSKTLSLCKESGQGKSIAFGNNADGFYTVSETFDEHDSKGVNLPILYYPLNIGDLNELFNMLLASLDFVDLIIKK